MKNEGEKNMEEKTRRGKRKKMEITRSKGGKREEEEE